MTLKCLKTSDGPGLQNAKTILLDAVVAEVRGRLDGGLSWNETAQKDLKNIFTLAHDLFRQLHQHSSSYYIKMVPVCSGARGGVRELNTFNPEFMDGIPEPEENVDGLPLEISVFPGVYRKTDNDRTTVREPCFIFGSSSSNRAHSHTVGRRSHRCVSESNGSTARNSYVVLVTRRRTW